MTPEIVPPEAEIEMYRRMLRIRYFELAVIELHSKGIIPGPVHLSIGEEGTIVGACMSVRDDDFMLGNHRSHGHPIAKNAELGPLMAELMGKKDGVCGGKGGSMHLADFTVGSLGESGIVGSGLPVAAGAGLSAKLRGTDQVCLAFFGDGAVNIGAFHESMNLTAVWALPVVFVCENNGYAVTTVAGSVTAGPGITERARGYGIPAVTVDGQDCLAVRQSVGEAVDRARRGDGPTLIEAVTYRYREHAEFGALRNVVMDYRAESEVAAWNDRDPIATHRARLSAAVGEEALGELEAAARQQVDEAISFGKRSPFPDPGEALTGLYAQPFPIVRGF